MAGVNKQMFNWTKLLCIHFQEDITITLAKQNPIQYIAFLKTDEYEQNN